MKYLQLLLYYNLILITVFLNFCFQNRQSKSNFEFMNNMKCYCSKPKNHRINVRKAAENSENACSTSETVPSRANSICDVRKRKNPVLTTGERSSSVPRPQTRRNANTVPQNYLKTRCPCPKINNNTKKIPIPTETPSSSTTNSPKRTPKLKPDKVDKNCVAVKAIQVKAPIPAPRTSFANAKKPAVEDYEYLQFSLRITEDIIRNGLYTQLEMRRVFNSHIEANRGRLKMTKMLRQIDLLCNVINISGKVSGNGINNKNYQPELYCACEEKVSDKAKESVVSDSTSSSSQSKESGSLDLSSSSSKNSKEAFLDKVIDGQHVMTEQEINNLTERDLQNVITKILNNNPDICPGCNRNKKPKLSGEIIELASPSSSENEEAEQSPLKLQISPVKNPSNTCFDLIHSNVDNFYNASSDNFKTISPCSSLEDNHEIKRKILEADKTTDDLNKTSNIEEKPDTSIAHKQKIITSDEIWKMVLKNISDDIDNDKDVLKSCDIDLHKPICPPEQLKESEINQPDQIKSLEDTDLSLSMSLSLQKEKSDLIEPDQKSSEDWYTINSSKTSQLLKYLDENASTNEIELATKCLTESYCARKMQTETKQNPLDVQPLTTEQSQDKNLCSVDPVCPSIGMRSATNEDIDMCSVDALCSKFTTKSTEQKPDILPVMKEDTLLDLERTEQNTPTKEETESKDMSSFNSVNSNLKTKGSEQISDAQPSISEQNKREVVTCELFCCTTKTNENEVSIVAQKSPVNNVNSLSCHKTSLMLDSKNTQTSFTAEEKPELVISSDSDTGVFHFDTNSSLNNKEDTTIVVYDKDNNLDVDNVYSELKPSFDENGSKNEKDVFISSITKYILDKTFSGVKENANYSEELKPVSEEKIDFVSTVEKLINDKTKDLYQYCVPAKRKSSSKSIEVPFRISSESLNNYQTENNNTSNISLKNSNRRNPVTSDSSGVSLSEGEICSKSSISHLTRKYNYKILQKSEQEILEHLKKYEQNVSSPRSSNILKPRVCDYEIKSYEFNSYERYVPKFRRSMFYPTVSTQTSNTDTQFKAGFNDNLLSDGEIQNTSSEADDTKTDFSENESSWR